MPEDVKKLGAAPVVDTNDKNFAQPLANKLGLIVTTMNATPSLPISKTSLLHAFDLVHNGAYIGGPHVGSNEEYPRNAAARGGEGCEAVDLEAADEGHRERD
ncbi:hypothetical protein PHLGIDRAFT_117681 [Phlebiopsis gigantea 11061_1 CR5-6]|uniref:Uncharacterized protein n=1 Tax=Phlebiopsis gigantea (strain 11061_1 CR5-6) TaxID=745531 RepID=A0A0C3PMN5_PHLG1|nr:hypothetical protein PHLGIDRAFT_117681 [Phlebiopsis gigantea 11061_1 CR5-6]